MTDQPHATSRRQAEQIAELRSRVLSSSQLQTLAAHGEERTARAGETLYEIGDESYPFIAILEGEAAVLDGAGREIVRHGPAGFLGEVNLLSGQTVFVTAVVIKPVRYVAVDREALRGLLFEDGSLATCCCPRSWSGARRCSSMRGSESRSSARASPMTRAGWSSSPAG